MNTTEYFADGVPSMGYDPEEALERCGNIIDGGLGFDKPWALAIMKGLLAGIRQGSYVRPEDSWIPVSERTPQGDGYVLVCHPDFDPPVFTRSRNIVRIYADPVDTSMAGAYWRELPSTPQKSSP